MEEDIPLRIGLFIALAIAVHFSTVWKFLLTVKKEIMKWLLSFIVLALCVTTMTFSESNDKDFMTDVGQEYVLNESGAEPVNLAWGGFVNISEKYMQIVETVQPEPEAAPMAEWLLSLIALAFYTPLLPMIAVVLLFRLFIGAIKDNHYRLVLGSENGLTPLWYDEPPNL